MDAEPQEKHGIEAVQRGDFAEAAQVFDRVARAHITAGELPQAFRVLSNLAMARKFLGDLRGGLAAVDEALALPVEIETRYYALLARGALLDGLDDPRAAAAWRETAASHNDPASIAFCRAHAAGAGLKHGDPQALAAARQVVKDAEAIPVSASQMVGIIGAVGESAGPAGVPMLAMATLIMVTDLRTFNPSTAPFWELLVERTDPNAEIVIGLTAFGALASGLLRGTPEGEMLLSRSRTVTRRVAAARGVPVEDVLHTIVKQFSNAEGQVHGSVLVPVLRPALLALIPDDQKVL